MTEHLPLRVKDLVVSYGEARVLNGVSLEVRKGEIVAIVGANGAGKTTLLKTISGLLRAQAGSIEFEGRDIGREAPHAITRSGLAHVPEGRMILKRMTTRDNLLLGADIASGGAEAERLDEVLDLFPALKTRLDDMAGILSGGQQQMLALGRALIGRPRVLMLDEPSLGLAPILVQEIFQIVERLRQSGNTILLVEQNAKRALTVADRAYVVELGRIVLDGPSQELLASDRMMDAYLGA